MNRSSLFQSFFFFLLSVLFLVPELEAAQKNTQQELWIYTARKEHLIKPVFDLYEKKSGVKIHYQTGKAGPLLKKIQMEGKKTAADVLMTVDAGNLWKAKQENLFAPIDSKVLNQNIPTHLKDKDRTWFGLSLRARSIIYNTKELSVKKGVLGNKKLQLKTYEDLAQPEWKGKLCLRTSKKVYNQSLVASMIANLGKKKTKSVLKGWVRNLAAPVFSSDSEVIKAVGAGRCLVGIVNTYYLARILKKDKSFNVSMFWPNQSDRGVHVNVSGAGILKSSKNKKEAVKFLEWLSGAEAQKVFAELNLEYPVNKKSEVASLVKSWGAFKEDKLPLDKAGVLQIDAVKLMSKAGYR